jgi:hypothetical protein
MKLYGQLESAQLEVLSSDPTPTPRARVYWNKSTSKARIYDGSAWKNFVLEGSTGIYDAGNSSTAKSINWDNGNVQKLTLTGNCLISFTGTPVDGTVYTLIVENTGTTIYSFRFDVKHEALKKNIQPIWLDYGEIKAFEFLYRSSPTASSTTLPAIGEGPLTTITNGSGTGRGVDLWDFAPGGNVLYVNGTGASTQFNYWRVEEMYGKVSFGARANASGSGAANTTLRISPSGRYVAIGYQTSPFISVSLMDTSGVFPLTSSFANPGTLPAGNAASVDWHPTEKAIALAHATTPFITAYPMTTIAFGTKYTNPATLPASTGIACAFSPFGDYLAVLHLTTPFLSVYPFDLTTGFGTKISDPGTLPPGNATNGGERAVAWRPQGDWILVASATSPYLWQCPFNRVTGAFGTAVAVSGSNLPSAEVLSIAFHPCGDFVFVGYTGGWYIYPFDATTGITNSAAYTNTTSPSGNVQSAMWSRDGKRIYFVRSTTALPESIGFPYTSRNWVRINDF